MVQFLFNITAYSSKVLIRVMVAPIILCRPGTIPCQERLA